MNPGDVIAGKYVLERKLGFGGMGEVWLASHRMLGTRYALKFLFPHLVSSHMGADIYGKFLREAQIGAQLDHPNIVRVYDIADHGGTYYLVMDYVEGTNLRDLITGNPMAPESIVAVGTQILAALKAAHDRGFVHRDVKPPNIIVTPAGKAYLTDFGIAKAVDNIGASGSLVFLSPEYAAPEQIEPERFGAAAAAADLYSLGVTMYHMATGRPPFSGTKMEILRKHTDRVPPRPEIVNRLIPGWLSDVVMKAVAKYPRERFPNAAAMAAALRRTSPPPPPPPPPRRTGDGDRPSVGRTGIGRKILIGALSVIGVTLTGVGIYAVIKNIVVNHPPPPAPTAATATTAAPITATPPAPTIATLDEKPRLIATPALAGLTVDAARATLKGFAVRVAPNDAGTTTGTVTAQDPAAGTELNPASGEWVFSLTKAAWDEKIWGTRRVIDSKGAFGTTYKNEQYLKDTVHHEAAFAATWAAKGERK